jgi:hypothetical protein
MLVPGHEAVVDFKLGASIPVRRLCRDPAAIELIGIAHLIVPAGEVEARMDLLDRTYVEPDPDEDEDGPGHLIGVPVFPSEPEMGEAIRTREDEFVCMHAGETYEDPGSERFSELFLRPHGRI